MASAHNELVEIANRAFGNMLFGVKASISVAYIATVVKYDKKHHTADILPLHNLSDGQTSAQVPGVPVSRNCYYMDEWWDRVRDYFEILDESKHKTKFLKQMTPKKPRKPQMHKGATVIVVVLDRDYQNWNPEASTTFTPETSRLHDISDSVIIGTVGPMD